MKLNNLFQHLRGFITKNNINKNTKHLFNSGSIFKRKT